MDTMSAIPATALRERSPTASWPLELQPLLERVVAYNPDADTKLLQQAYDLARDAHEGQSRESGEPYLEHPLAVAHILADLESDVPTLAAGLLHDVVEDTSVSLPSIKKRFGKEVALLVDGVTKLSQTELHRRRLSREAEADDDDATEITPETQRKQAANIRKIFLAMAQDVRVMIIKLADRLHNVSTLDDLPPERRRRIAQETLEIFAPIAHRLGIWHLKWQLEDLSFRHVNPEAYRGISSRLNKTRDEREADVEELRGVLQRHMDEAGIEAEVQGRPKHLYSIHNKIVTQNLKFDQLLDLIGVRVITGTVAECYHVLGIVHQLWLPIPRQFSDYIARPKPNLYQSLHTKVIGPRGEPFEIQIRTREMHRTADFGIAAHWGYKSGSRAERSDRRLEQKLHWFRQQLTDWETDSASDTDFMQSVREDLFADQVFVFTPRGDVIDLPQGSCPIDFAFRIHTEIGLQVAGALVNRRPVKLDYQVQDGDIIQILTRPSATPKYEWLTWVQTSHARSRIRAWFRKQRYSQSMEKGRELVLREAKRLEFTLPQEDSEELRAVANGLHYTSVEDLLAAVGYRHVAPRTIINRLRKQQPTIRELVTGKPTEEARLSLSAGGADDVFIRRSRCCHPLPGDEVLGFVTRGSGLAMHRRGCPNIERAAKAEPERVVEVSWRQDGHQRHPVPLHIETMDRVGVMSDISVIFSDSHVNVENANIRTREGASARWDVVVSVETVKELNDLTSRIARLPDVLAVRRVGTPRRR